jgi:hypothetical protein
MRVCVPGFLHPAISPFTASFHTPTVPSTTPFPCTTGSRCKLNMAFGESDPVWPLLRLLHIYPFLYLLCVLQASTCLPRALSLSSTPSRHPPVAVSAPAAPRARVRHAAVRRALVAGKQMVARRAARTPSGAPGRWARLALVRHLLLLSFALCLLTLSIRDALVCAYLTLIRCPP